MRSIFQAADAEALQRRIDRLAPDSSRRWGRMTAHQAVCHLSDSLKAALGMRPIKARPVTLLRRVARVLAFSTPMPWPRGVRTSREVDAEKGGTPPGSFEQDRAELQALLQRFAATQGTGLDPHYAWGDLSRGEWGRYVYRHTDHHLRQFGV